MTRESYRVALWVLVDFPGGDAWDAASGASIALQQAFPDGALTLHMRGQKIEGRFIRAMDVGMAAANGKLVLALPNAVRSGRRSEADDQMLRSPAPPERLEEAARWLVDHAHPDDPGIQQSGDLTVENVLGGGDLANFARISANDRHPELADVTNEYYRVIEHASMLGRQEW